MSTSTQIEEVCKALKIRPVAYYCGDVKKMREYCGKVEPCNPTVYAPGCKYAKPKYPTDLKLLEALKEKLRERGCELRLHLSSLRAFAKIKPESAGESAWSAWYDGNDETDELSAVVMVCLACKTIFCGSK